jgi:hypothetical protein
MSRVKDGPRMRAGRNRHRPAVSRDGGASRHDDSMRHPSKGATTAIPLSYSSGDPADTRRTRGFRKPDQTSAGYGGGTA